MVNIFLVGRVIFGGFFLINAYNHFAHAGNMAGYAASKGVPAPKLAILGSGVLLLIGGLSILTGLRQGLGLIAVIIFLIPVSLTMHAFWKDTDPMQKMNNRINFMKNMALIGAALMLFSVPTPWPFSL